MRRSLLPIFLAAVGLFLILLYLNLRDQPAQPGAETRLTESTDLVISTSSPTTSSSQIEGTTDPTSLEQLDAIQVTPSLTPTQTPSRTPLPISPSPTADPGSLASVVPMTATLSSQIIPETETCLMPDCQSRYGVSGKIDMVVAARRAGLPFGGYFNWWAESDPPPLEGAEFWQMVGITREGPELSWMTLGEVIAAQPGSIWIIGNEPDIVWQDNVRPDRYAQIYHDVYTFIKDRDPTARVAIAAVGQPTPLRLAYLDIVLETYEAEYGQSMPVDIWTVHAFILREEDNSWGVGIPPGMEETAGRLYEIPDHANLDIFQQNILEFRAWMADRGYADRPLAVTEFGILHPSDYGFPPEVVAKFMAGAIDFFLHANGEDGYAADGNRLVQWWFWYSVYDGGDFPTGNLYDPERDRLTEIGEVYAAFAGGE